MACYAENIKKFTSFPLLRLLFGNFIMLCLSPDKSQWLCFVPHQVLCPRCDIGLLGLKRKQRKLKEPLPSGKKKSPRVESLSDLERTLMESRETASAVRAAAPLFSGGRAISSSSFFTGYIGKASKRITSRVFCFTKATLGKLSFVKVLNGRCLRGLPDSETPPKPVAWSRANR